MDCAKNLTGFKCAGSLKKLNLVLIASTLFK